MSQNREADTQNTQLRPQVQQFAELMEQALRRKDESRGERGWEGDHADELFWSLSEHVTKLRTRLRDGSYTESDAADVANFAMMVWDVKRNREMP